MRSSLLLLLSLMTGCEARSEESTVKACKEGWVEFSCKYPNTNVKYQRIDVDIPKGRNIRSTLKDEWENKWRVSVYHDTKNKNLRLAIKPLQHEDFGKYECEFNQGPGSSKKAKEVKLKEERTGCQSQWIQTAYRTAETTITCDYTGNKDKFLCKDNGSTCEDLLPTKSSVKSNGTFTLTETDSGLSVSISNVSSQHAGVYWCGEESGGRYRAALRRIQLEVKDTITTFTRSPTIGQNFTYWCRYPNDATENKFICKGEDPSTCQPLISTVQGKNNTGRFSMEDSRKRNITITVREVTPADTGTYWCGAESSDETRSHTFFHRFVMTVVAPTASPTASTSPASSNQTIAAAAERRGGVAVFIAVIVCVAVLLLFVLIFILVCKRLSPSKNTRKAAEAQHIKEDYVYEEIQQRVLEPDSGNAIYSTATFPTNPCASPHYSTINIQSSSDRAGGEALILKPSFTACEYSTVKHSQSPTCSAVSQPAGPSEDPLYSTVNKPQRE